MLDTWCLMLDACQVDAALPPCSALERIAPRHAHRCHRTMWSELPWNLSDISMNPIEATSKKHSHIFWNPGNLPWRQNCPHPRRKGTLVNPQIMKIRHLPIIRNILPLFLRLQCCPDPFLCDQERECARKEELCKPEVTSSLSTGQSKTTYNINKQKTWGCLPLNLTYKNCIHVHCTTIGGFKWAQYLTVNWTQT